MGPWRRFQEASEGVEALGDRSMPYTIQYCEASDGEGDRVPECAHSTDVTAAQEQGVAVDCVGTSIIENMVKNAPDAEYAESAARGTLGTMYVGEAKLYSSGCTGLTVGSSSRRGHGEFTHQNGRERSQV